MESELNDAGTEAFTEWQGWRTRYLNAMQAASVAAEVNVDDASNNSSSCKSLADILTAMAMNNPVYILRNSMAQTAIEQATLGDFAEVDRLYQLLAAPYQVHPLATSADTQPPAPNAPMLPISCSS